jgi:hypothetical protein
VVQLLEKRPRDRLGYAVDVARRLGATELPEARVYLYRPALVGRERALHTLQELAQQPLGPARLVLLSGESGIGKTKLATELGRHAERQGMLVATGECLPGEPRLLAAFSGLLRALADHCGTSGQDLLGAHGPWLWPYAPFLAELPGQQGLAPPEPLPLPAARHRLHRALLEVLLAFVAGRPFVLLLDDLQWADELTLEWLHTLLTLREPPHWLIVGTCRSEEGRERMVLLRALSLEIPLERLAREELVQDAGFRTDLGVLSCREARMAHLRGDGSAATRALGEAEEVAQQLGVGPLSVLGHEISWTQHQLREISPESSARDTHRT